MLHDIITIVMGLVLLLMGTQTMLDPEVRTRSVEVVKSVTLVIGGLFLLNLWNMTTRLNNA